MNVKLMRRGALCVLTATLALHPAEDPAAQIGGGVFAFPTGGLDQQQQSFDQFECHQWSVQQSGFDPAVQQQAQQQRDAGMDAYTRAYSACMSARNYQVQ